MINKKSMMAGLLSFAIFVGSPLMASASELSEALEATQSINTISIEASGQRFEPQQTLSPASPPRHVSDYDVTTLWQPNEGQAEEQWRLKTVYPFPNNLAFKASYLNDRGVRSGRDGFRPNSDGPISGARLGAVMKDLWLTNPVLLLSMADDEAVAGASTNPGTKTFTIHDTEWTISFDQSTGLPSSVTTIESDPLEGVVTNSVQFEDWRMTDGVPFPYRLQQKINGQLVKREVRTAIAVNEAGADITLPDDTNALTPISESEKLRGWEMSHFFLRRAMIGAPSDGDESAKVEINKVGDGLYQITGSSHHNIVIEGRRGLAIVDAVWYPRRSEAILKALKAKWPRKPIRYVILTHHHVDHTGGLSTYASLDATVVTHSDNFEYFYNILKKTQAEAPRMRAVNGRLTIDGIGRSIELFDIPNNHAADMIGVYVPDAKTVINSDLYSPGRPTQQPVWAAEFAAAVRYHGLDVESHLGSHGNGAEPHENLLKLVHGE